MGRRSIQVRAVKKKPKDTPAVEITVFGVQTEASCYLEPAEARQLADILAAQTAKAES